MTTASPSCLACRTAAPARGVLCATCAVGLVDEGICPEQITPRLRAPQPGIDNALLIDGFGVPHVVALDAAAAAIGSAVLGRARTSDVAVAEQTVSQRHAALEFRARSRCWFVADAGAENGTFVNGDRVRTRFPLEPGDRVMLGRRVGFVFVPLEEAELPMVEQALAWLRGFALDEPTLGDHGDDDGVELRVAAVREGGALARWGGDQAQLSELEYELLVVLHQRHAQDADADASVRGFVPGEALLERLAFRSEAPTHANLRGLVRKLRKKLIDASSPIDVIESRRGLGYRLARSITLA